MAAIDPLHLPKTPPPPPAPPKHAPAETVSAKAPVAKTIKVQAPPPPVHAPAPRAYSTPKNAGDVGQLQPAHTPAPKRAPSKDAPAPRHAINIIG